MAIAGVDKLEAAIEWLKMSAEIYPKEAVFYGTLGDFYQKQKRPEQTTEPYKKALEIDPGFEYARES